jgi:hypothetical protein
MTNVPSPRRGGGSGTLECFSRDFTGLHRDVAPAGAVFPVAVSPVRPSPPLQRHAGHYDDIPDAVGAHGDGTSPCLTLCLVRIPVDGTLESANGRRPDGQPLHRHPRSCSVQAQDAPRRPNRSKIRQDRRQLRGTACHASTRRRIVRHTCKLLPPWPIKGEAVPQPQTGGRRIAITSTLSAFTMILALASINTSGTWRPDLLSRHTCSPLYEHHGAKQYSAPSTPLLDVRPRSDPG